MRRVLCVMTAAALLTTMPGLVSEALAHGGQYRGPAGEVPGDSREPSDPPPPPEDGGPETPGGDGGGPETGGDVGGGPDTGGGDTPAPDTGGGPSGPDTGGDGPAGPTTGGGGGPAGKRGGKKALGYEDWTFWWNYNKDEILQLKSELKARQRGTRSGTSVHRFGGGGSTGDVKITATDAAIQNNIMPALREMLNQDDLNFDIQSAAALALAKIGDESIIETLKAMGMDKRADGKGDYHKVVTESAGLAFGLLQKDSDDIRSFLIGIVMDKERDGSFVRAFSAISLGLLGEANGEAGATADQDGKTVSAMLEILERKETGQEIKPAALLALGLLKNDAVVPDLFFMLENEKVKKGGDEFSDNEMPWVVEALGRIGKPGLTEGSTEIVDELIKRVDKKKGKDSINVRRSAAIALGKLAARSDDKTVSKILLALKKTANDAKDHSVSNFAMISIGRIGSDNRISDKQREESIELLGYLMDKAKPSSIKQPFAALALGLVGRNTSDRKLVEEKISSKIREKFAEESNPRTKASFAIASGLLRDPVAVDAIVKELTDKGAEKKLRGYCAIALGMIQDPAGKLAITKVLQDDADRELRVQTAVAAGLIGDGAVIDPLVEILKDADASQYILGSVALALGQIGDERAIAPLLAISKDTEKKFPDLTRALATVALGQIGDRRDVPVLARVAVDINYRAHVAAIAELLTIL